MRAPFEGSGRDLFARVQAQGGSAPALVETDDWVIGSGFAGTVLLLQGERLVSKPMKGTVPRGLRLQDDQAQADWLQRSRKEPR